MSYTEERQQQQQQLLLHDIKEEEDVELRQLMSRAEGGVGAVSLSETSLASMDEKENVHGVVVQEEEDEAMDKTESKDELALLPPLPTAIESLPLDESVTAGAISDLPLEASGLGETIQAHSSLDLLSQSNTTQNSFDLSNALKIPNDPDVTSVSADLNITSPKLSLKKKFSNALLNTDISSSSSSSIPILATDASEAALEHVHIPSTLPHGDSMSTENGSSSSIQNFFRDKKLVSNRKCSNSSQNSSNSVTRNSTEERLYKLPPQILSRSSPSAKSRSDSNTMKHYNLTNKLMISNSLSHNDAASSTISTPLSFTADASSYMDKKPPLLKRASSALLRKASMKNNENENHKSARVSLTGTRTYSESQFFNSTIDNPQGGLRRTRTSNDDPTELETLHYVTQLDYTAPLASNKSLGTRVKRGFSRIINTRSPMKRAVSSSIVRPAPQLTPTGSNSNIKLEHVHSNPEEMLKTERNTVPHFTRSPISASSAVISPLATNFKEEIHTPTPNSALKKTPTNTEEFHLDSEGLTVDIDELTNTIPVITVTDGFSNSSPSKIRLQSNVTIDKVYQGKTNTTGTNKHPETHPAPISLKEYVKLLIHQQQAEDERLAALEKFYGESGWSSANDIKLLKQKRILINRKWAERISFYQNKLEV